MVDIPATIQANWPLLKKHGLTKACTFQVMPVQVYDANTGSVTGDPTATHPLDIVFDEFNHAAVDGEAIRFTDRKALFPVLDLPVVPHINDRIVSPSNVTWRVVAGPPSDPADAHYSLHVRPIDEP